MVKEIEFMMLEKNFETSYTENAYTKCQKMVNYICRYNKLSNNCIKLYQNCEKLKNLKNN